MHDVQAAPPVRDSPDTAAQLEYLGEPGHAGTCPLATDEPSIAYAEMTFCKRAVHAAADVAGDIAQQLAKNSIVDQLGKHLLRVHE